MRRIRKFAALFLALALAVTLAVPGTTKASAASKKYVKSLKVASKVTVEKGKTKKITPTVKVVKKASKEVTVTSKKPSIAKASYKKGKIVIQGKKVGSTTVTVKTKAKNKKGKKITKKIKVTVTKAKSKTPVAPTTTIAPPTTQAPIVVKVTGITISPDSATMLKGAVLQLNAQVTPGNAVNKSITWKSSSNSVASVNASGKVTAKAAGTAAITATNSYSGVSATCSITVQDSVEVTTQAQLNHVLNNASVAQIILTPASGSEITVPSGNYSGTNLIIKGDGSKVTNQGEFTEVFVQGGSYVEASSGNVVSVKAPSTVEVTENATATVNVNIENGKKADEVKVINNGTLNELAIKSGSTVRLSGNAEETVTASISSEDVKLVSNQNLTLSCTEKAELVLTGDTSETTVKVDKEANIPDIAGVGTIPVTIGEDKSPTMVEAHPSDELDPVTITGKVVDAYEKTSENEAALEGVAVSLVPASGDAIKITTDTEGAYKFDSVICQNYSLKLEKEGYKTAIQSIAPNSRYGDFVNQTIELLSEEKADNNTASISGIVNNAADKKGVEGITVELRDNLGNIVGEAVKSVVTDAEGNYSFNNLEAGYYTLYTVDKRADVDEKYISVKENICLQADKEVNKNMTISTSIKGGGIRFVLTWGSQGNGVPADLDSHIYGPRVDGKNGMFEVYFSSKGYGLGNTDYTVLDVDETDYNGPETVTILKPVNGVYYYYVHNYSGYYDEDGDLTTSQAKVDVYSGSELLTTYNVPQTGQGYWWKVCKYNPKTGKLTAINTIVEDTDFEDVFYGHETYIKDITITSDRVYEYQLYLNGLVIDSDSSWADIKDTVKVTVDEGFEAKLENEYNEEEGKEMPYLNIYKNNDKVESYPIYIESYYDDEDY